MKKLVLFVSALFISLTFYGQAHYYYYEGKKVPLTLDNSKKFVLLNPDFRREDLLTQLNLNPSALIEFTKSRLSRYLNLKANTAVEMQWTVISDNRSADSIGRIIKSYTAPFFKGKNGVELGLSHLFYVKLQSERDRQLLDSLANVHNLEVIGNDQFMPRWFIMACNYHSDGNALEMANYFYETGLFTASQPDLMEDNLIDCVNDTQFDNQWSLLNSGQGGGTSGADIEVCNAWNLSTGCNEVVVAVLDQGIEDHEDLNNIFPIEFDTENGNPPYGNHGMLVGGIIGADRNNALGISGISPESPIMDISNSLQGIPGSRIARADGINFAWQNGAEVINNSWSSGVQYQVIDDAIENAVTQGRIGLGTIVIFASGNDSNNSISYPSTNPNVIAVGATDRNDNRASFSNYGDGLDVVAPGVDILTTDLNDGYNTVSGTSFAAPHVAGIAALILSINPDLNQQEVREIIESTTDKVGGISYTPGAGENPNLTWNNQMGYGRVNARRAVEAIMPISGPYYICTSNTTFTLQNRPAGTTVAWTHSDNLAYISGQGTDNYVVTKTASGEGIGWVQATINGPCGQVVLPQKQVWVGSPELDGYISGSSSVNCDGISIYEYTGGVYGDQDIRWEVSLQFDDVSSVAGYELFVDPTNEGDGYVTFVASNSCGEAILCKPVSVSGVSCGPGYINFPNPYSCGGSFALSAEEDDITIYPNPADQELSILNLPEGVEVIMFNKGMEALHTGYTGNEEPYCIPLSHLRADVYFLHLLMGEERVIRQVVVEHE